jgi:thiamine-monophosphate kinase
VAAALDFRPEELALSGGEDYELLMALAEDDLGEATRLCGPVPLTVVGTVLHSDQGVSLEGEGGSRSPLPSSGWRHF